MACFGEINIPSSRAFWDDFEGEEIPAASNLSKVDNEIQQRLKEFGLKMKDLQKTIKSLLIIEGPDISEFAENTFLQGREWKRLIQLPEKNSSVHFLENELRIMVIIDENLTFSGKIADLVIQFLESERVITLNVKSRVEYKSEKFRLFSDEITFLRTLVMQEAGDKELGTTNPKIPPPLEVPNFISGVAAGVASWRYNAGLPVESYVAYTDKTALDTLSAQPIIKLLQQRGIPCKDTFHSKRIQETNLYM